MRSSDDAAAVAASRMPLLDTGLHELGEQRSRYEIFPAELVDPTEEDRRRGLGVPVSEAQRDAGLHGVGLPFEALEQLLGLQPCPASGATSRRRRSARASQPRAAASLSNASPYSRASQSATRAEPPRARPSPSSASAESVASSAS